MVNDSACLAHARHAVVNNVFSYARPRAIPALGDLVRVFHQAAAAARAAQLPNRSGFELANSLFRYPELTTDLF